MRPGAVVISSLQHAVQRAYAVAESVNEAAGGPLEIAYLHQRSGEIQIRNIDGFPLRSLGREAIANRQLRAAGIGKNRSIEAESGAGNHTIVGQVLLDLIGAREAYGH